jgi:acyl-CoA thioesterase-1
MRVLARRFYEKAVEWFRAAARDLAIVKPDGGYGRRALVVNALAITALLFAGIAQAQTRPRLVVLGDSLTAGYGLPKNQAFPARLQAALTAQGLDIEVVDAGVSGDTSAGGLARLDWAIGNSPPDYAIVELGANDGLRGLPPRAMQDNLDAIITRLKARNIRVLLAGMRAPRNLGREYAEEFDAVFVQLAKKHDVPLYPFFLDGVATNPDLNQGDGLHPNAAGVDAIVERILPFVKKLVAAS